MQDLSLRTRAEIVVGLIRLLRPRQWVKNVFLFPALLFAGRAFTADTLTTLLGFMIFCIASSAVYVLNDILDAESDRLHPRKQHRPIAAGVISKPVAWGYCALLTALWIPAALRLSLPFAGIAGLYTALQVAYSLGLKRLFLVDVMVISLGFVMRAVAGALLISVPVSPWLLVCTTLLSLFLALGKRRQELTVAPAGHRKVLETYSVGLVDQLLSALTGTTIMAYSMYTFLATPMFEMMWTIPFVVYGLFRYLYLIHRSDLSGTPEEVLLTDRPMIANVALWAAGVAYILYR